jgi:hypothetical protein
MNDNDKKDLADASLSAVQEERGAVPMRVTSYSTKRVYGASKTRHAPMWRGLRDAGWNIISTWIDEAGDGQSLWPDLWTRCIFEAASADALILYAEEGDVLKGAFVEAGAALSAGVPVYVVNPQPSWSFVHHPLVAAMPSVAYALESINA